MSKETRLAENAVFEAARALGSALQASPQWEEFQSARAAFDSDSELRTLIARHRQLSASWRIAKASGRGLMGEDAGNLAQMQAAIQTHPLFVRQQAAIKSLMAMFQQANQAISAELELDFAANAAPRGGGCCG